MDIVNASLNNLLQTDEGAEAHPETPIDLEVELQNEPTDGTLASPHQEVNNPNPNNFALEQGAVGGPSVGVSLADHQELIRQNQQMMVILGKVLERLQGLEVAQNETRYKTANSTGIEKLKNAMSTEKASKSSQKDPVDFLDWIKQKNESLSSVRTQDENIKKSELVPESNREPIHTNMNGRRWPIHKWKIVYDGMDNGRRLNEFLKDVEFNARSEGFSSEELFHNAHHLFIHKARSWLMEVNSNEELGSWENLVKELKAEFLPYDVDFVHERQAVARKQGPREKFQDFYLDMVRIFRSMSHSWDEKRKFDALFRNTREDCRIAMLAANVDNIAKMKEFGKKFDSINWQLYKRREIRSGTNMIEELGENRRHFQANNRTSNAHQNKPPNKNFNSGFDKQPPKREWKGKQYDKEPLPQIKIFPKENPKPKTNDFQNPGPSGVSNTNALRRIVQAYIPVKRNTCFNCHEPGHNHNDCRQEKNIFCMRCGFPGFVVSECPYCEIKNGPGTSQ